MSYKSTDLPPVPVASYPETPAVEVKPAYAPEDDEGDGIDTGSVTIVGTAHVSEKSGKTVRQAIKTRDPDIVAVELDERRARGILKESIPDGEVGESDSSVRDGTDMLSSTRVVESLLRRMQQKLADSHGIEVDEMDMSVALTESAVENTPVILIDRDSTETLSSLLDGLSRRGFLRLSAGIAGAFIGISFGLVSESTVDELADNPRKARRALSERYPAIANVLIHERDELMAEQLVEFARRGSDVMAIVGAAHEPGIEGRIREYNKGYPFDGISDRTPLIPAKQLNSAVQADA